MPQDFEEVKTRPAIGRLFARYQAEHEGAGIMADDDVNTLHPTDEAKQVMSIFVENVRVATRCPTTYKSKLDTDLENSGRNIMKWSTGALELWFYNSKDPKSNGVGVKPVLTFPIVPGTGNIKGFWNSSLESGDGLEVEMDYGYFVAKFSVERSGDQLFGWLNFKSDLLGSFHIETELCKIHDQPEHAILKT